MEKKEPRFSDIFVYLARQLNEQLKHLKERVKSKPSPPIGRRPIRMDQTAVPHDISEMRDRNTFSPGDQLTLPLEPTLSPWGPMIFDPSNAVSGIVGSFSGFGGSGIVGAVVGTRVFPPTYQVSGSMHHVPRTPRTLLSDDDDYIFGAEVSGVIPMRKLK